MFTCLVNIKLNIHVPVVKKKYINNRCRKTSHYSVLTNFILLKTRKKYCCQFHPFEE